MATSPQHHDPDSDVRPTSPNQSTKDALKRPRAKSGAKATRITPERAVPPLLPEDLVNGKPTSSAYGPTQPGASQQQRASVLPPTVPESGNTLGKRWRPRPRGLDERREHITLHDIIQSRWIPDPDDHSLDKVFLTIEDAPLDEMSGIDTRFGWTHHQRDPDQMRFEDLVGILAETPGLYDYELRVASKLLEEVKPMRKTFARGRYFEPLVHQTTEVLETSGQKNPVKATFISVPIFSMMRSYEESHLEERTHHGRVRRPLQTIFDFLHKCAHDEEYNRSAHHQLSSHKLRTNFNHPTRSLMRYSNVLAVDNSRDLQQAVICLGDHEDIDFMKRPFVHVPELWAISINMFFVVTCAPFSCEDLCGGNIEVLRPPPQDQRVLVKYTNLKGIQHDFRCRTWLGVLDMIYSIEQNIDDLSVLLNEERSEYKLVDPKFRLYDRNRWDRMTASDATDLRSISVRLIYILPGQMMNLEFAGRKLQKDIDLVTTATWLKLTLKRTQEQFDADRRRSASSHELNSSIKMRQLLKSSLERNRKLHVFNRFMLCAARYYLMDPEGVLWQEDEVYLGARLAKPVKRKNRFTGTDRKNSEKNLRGNNGTMRHTGLSTIPKPPILPQRSPNGNTLDEWPSGAQPAIPNGSSSRNTQLARDTVAKWQQHPTGHHGGLHSGQSTIQIKRQLPVVTADEVNEVFRPPQRIKTSPILSDGVTLHRGIVRAYTFADIDLEAQRSLPGQRVQSANAFRSNLIPLQALPQTLPGADLRKSPRPVPRAKGQSASPGFPNRQAALITPAMLAATPERLPVHTPAVHGATVTKIATTNSPVNRTEGLAIDTSTLTDQVNIPTARSNPYSTGNVISVTLSLLYARRDKQYLKHWVPFFEWRKGIASPSSPLDSRPNHSLSTLARMSKDSADLQTSGDSRVHNNTEITMGALDVVDYYLNQQHLVSDDFQIQSQHYAAIEEKSIYDVTSALDAEHEQLTADIHDQEHAGDEALAFLETKKQLLLTIDGIVRYFVNDASYDDKIIRKIWGILFDISQLSIEDVRPVAALFGRRTFWWAEKQLESIEQHCRELGMFVRPEKVEDQDGQLQLPLPPVFFVLLRNIVLFLLSIRLIVQDVEQYRPAVEVSRSLVRDSLTECETALLRTARDVKDQDDIGYESIHTADTLLGLILQNAFWISCRDEQDKQEMLGKIETPHCDLKSIYRRYTTICHSRARQEASVHMYEEVRLLCEEIDTVLKVLNDQQTAFGKMVQLRQSSKQILDHRLNQRIRAHLAEMITHFETLKQYADEAQTLTTDSINIRREDNSKAIYIFTAVTIVFLPLSFVSGIFGMNTTDIRDTQRTSALFWEIALPFTAMVLFLCALLVKIKFRFRLRRRFGSAMLKFFPRDWISDAMDRRRRMMRLPRSRFSDGSARFGRW